MRTTIKDVAQRAGVSIGTVSNVLNGKPGEYGEETRRRVLEAIRALDYHPNRIARSLVQRASRTLGFSIVDQTQSLSSNPYLAEMLDGLLRAAREESYNIMLYTSLSQDAQEPSVSDFLDRRIDALCLIAPHEASPLPALLAETDLPFLIAGSEHPSPVVSWIDVDNALGARMAMEHLFACGHTRIAHLAGSPDQWDAQARAVAYQDALVAHGFAPNTDWLLPCGFNEKAAYQAACALLQHPNPPTAVFAANDLIAFGVLAAARDNGVRVPEELSVVGFDDIREARFSNPPLTTIRQPMREIGYDASKWLISVLRGEVMPPMQRRVVPTLIVRNTVARI